MPALLLPLALAALFAVVVPLAIHLARRDEQRPTVFAALQWLRQKPKPQQRLRFDEWPLLLARLLLLALLALWLARPVLHDGADITPYIAVMPGVDASAVTDAKASRHWLASGFPDLNTAPPSANVPFASLLRQLDADLPAKTRLTVVVPATLQGADAERPTLSRQVDWRVVAGAGAMASSSAVVSPSPVLVVRYAPGQEAGLRYIRGLAAAWQTPFEAGSMTDALPATGKTLVWLAPGPLPATVTDWVRRGGTALLGADARVDGALTPYWRDSVGTSLVEGANLGKGRVLHFTRPLTPADMPALLDADFPDHVRAVLAGHLFEPARVAAAAYTPLTGGMVYPQAATDLQPWLAILIALVFGCERWLATSRRRGVTP